MNELPIPGIKMYKHVALSGATTIIITLVFAGSRHFDIHHRKLETGRYVPGADIERSRAPCLRVEPCGPVGSAGYFSSEE